MGVAFAIIESEVAPSLKLFHKGQNIAVYFPKDFIVTTGDKYFDGENDS